MSIRTPAHGPPASFHVMRSARPWYDGARDGQVVGYSQSLWLQRCFSDPNRPMAGLVWKSDTGAAPSQRKLAPARVKPAIIYLNLHATR